MIRGGLRVLLVWEAEEERSWNPVLARLLRDSGFDVVEAHALEDLRSLDLRSFDACLPRFRMNCASMMRLDEVLTASGIPMLNARSARIACENKALAYACFERAGLPQPPAAVVDVEGAVDEEPAWRGETVVKPLFGCRSAGIEILDSPAAALDRAREREEDLLLQQMIWPARSWRVIAGRCCGAVDPYWRRPSGPAQRIHAISTGAEIARDPAPPAVAELAVEMCEAVDGSLLAADVLERDGQAWALEINHNFDAHGGDRPAVEAFRRELGELILATVSG